MKLRLGTRGSRLARAQSAWVAERLGEHGHEVETVIVETRGDVDGERAFAEIGAPGVFVRELERALQDGRVDLVVHSYKDLPSQSPAGLEIAAVPERLDPADRLLVRADAVDPERRDSDEGRSALVLPLAEGAVVGTASARRQALVHDLRADLEVRLLRGNVPTRLDKLRAGDYDAILLAAAGLERLERAGGLDRAGLVEIRLDPAVFVAAPSQGALALQVRDADDAVRQSIAALDDAAARRAVRAERHLLARVEGGCHVPFGAYCHALDGDRLRLDAVYGVEIDGVIEMRRASGEGDDPIALAESLVPTLLASS